MKNLKVPVKFLDWDSPRVMRLARWAAACLLLFVLSAFLGLNPSVPVFLVCLAAYLRSLRTGPNLRPVRLLYLSLLFVLIVAASAAILERRWTVALVPYSVAPMLAVLLFNDLVIAFFLIVACAVTVAGFSNRPEEIIMLFLVSGLVSGLLVFGARRRTTITAAGAAVGAAQVLVSFFLQGMSFADPLRYAIFFLNGIASAMIVTGLLPIFEYLFGTITNIKLLELADFTQPALNQLMLQAPGTYHHSFIVGNLSEAACSAIGANSLLARVGAYYHDIGKLQKPDYFAENQQLTNVHETLAPHMSKLVIMNHVKEGVELAKKYRLNPALVDFVRQHHGTSLVYFFYRKALEKVEVEEQVSEEGFRYPGPKPDTRETAVVLLADSVEAATRSLKEPTPSKIEEIVHKIINNKFIDGQLDECDLTLKDLEKIAGVFAHILGGSRHTRVDYPERSADNSQ